MDWYLGLGIIAIIILIALYAVSIYNKLITLKNRIEDQWAQVHVQLKRRADLIPNLMETVKGYAKHEKETFEEVVSARNRVSVAETPEAEMEANNVLTNAIGKLFALVESYPELKANENFLGLQNDLRGIEEKIAFARQFYNDRVLEYNNKVEMFPSNVIASMFKFEGAKYFEVSEEDTKVPTVKF